MRPNPRLRAAHEDLEGTHAALAAETEALKSRLDSAAAI
jgi:hypothetical protein